MKKLYILLQLVVYPAVLNAQIVISEIMFNPAGSERENEFIEIYNCGHDPVDLHNWLLDDGQKFNSIQAIDQNCLINPHSFAVLLVTKYYENSLIYESLIPPGTLRLTVDKAQFGGYGLNNSTPETISIYTPDSTLVDSCTFSIDNTEGFSDEKILLDVRCENNWANSLVANGTPGAINSVSPMQVDAALLFVQLAKKIADDISPLVKWNIRNSGLAEMDHFSLFCIMDDSLIFQKEHDCAPLNFQDSLQITTQLPTIPSGLHTLLFCIQLNNDNRQTNDSCTVQIKVFSRKSYHDIVINEIMYNTDEKQQEWLELYNPGSTPVNLLEWTISDKNKTVMITDSSLSIYPGAFLVLANAALPDTPITNQVICSLPELNNSGDQLLLQDAVATRIDSVHYNSYWGGERMQSLERIKPNGASNSSANWGTSNASIGHSAGMLNSISQKSYDASLDNLRIDGAYRQGETICIQTDIKNCGYTNMQHIEIAYSYQPISEQKSYPIETITIDALPLSDSLCIFSEWENATAGVYKVYAQLLSTQDKQAKNDTATCSVCVAPAQQTIVINEIMPAPANGYGEWIELYNPTTTEIELVNWTISNANTEKKSIIHPRPYQLQPNSFCVIGQDSLLCDCYLADFPTFSNNGDAVNVYAGNGLIIDAMRYSKDLKKGISLERINPHVDSQEASNWNFHAGSGNHSAGQANSIFIETIARAAELTVTPNVFSPDGDGLDDFAAIRYQLCAPVNQIHLKIYDIRGRLVRFLMNNEISPSEQTIFWDGRDDRGRSCRMGIYIVYLQAQDTENNTHQLKTTVVLAGRL